MELGIPAARSVPVKERDPFNTECAARQILDHVTSRWGVWVLLRLQEQPLRFYELRDHIEGISEKMLSQTLRNLAKDDLVWRRVEPTSPPQVTYGLTPLGSGLRGHLAAMLDWIEDNAEPAHAPAPSTDAGTPQDDAALLPPAANARTAKASTPAITASNRGE